MTLLSGVFAYDRTRFSLGHRSILVTTPTGKQKGYNVDHCWVQVKDGYAIVVGAFRYLTKGSAVVQTNWKILSTPAYTVREELVAGLTQRKPVELRFVNNERYHVKFELDEQTERDFMVWLDERAEQES